MTFVRQGPRGSNRLGASSGRATPRRGQKGMPVLLMAAAGVFVTPLAAALVTSGPAAAASSNVDPNGVLKYGFDLNNEFDNDFAPATEENDCSFTVTSNIYQSMAFQGTPRSPVASPRAGPSRTAAARSRTTSGPDLEFSNGQPVTSDRRGGQPEQHQDQARSDRLSSRSRALRRPIPRRWSSTSKPHCGRSSCGRRATLTARSTRRARSPPSRPSPSAPAPSSSRATARAPTSCWPRTRSTGIPRPIRSAEWTSPRSRRVPKAATALTSGAVDMIEVEPQNYPQLKNDPNIGISTTKSYDDMEIELRQNTGTVRQREGQVGARVRRRPPRAEQGRFRRPRASRRTRTCRRGRRATPSRLDPPTPTAPPRPRPCSSRPATPRA